MIIRDPIDETRLNGIGISFSYDGDSKIPDAVTVTIDGSKFAGDAMCDPEHISLDWLNLTVGEKNTLKTIFQWGKAKLDNLIGETGTLPPLPGE